MDRLCHTSNYQRRIIDYLTYRLFFSFQRCLYKTVKTVPDSLKGVLDQETFTKARLYGLDKSTFGCWSSLYSQIESTVGLNLHSSIR